MTHEMVYDMRRMTQQVLTVRIGESSRQSEREKFTSTCIVTQLLFSFHLITRLLKSQNAISDEDFSFFLTGDTAVDAEKHSPITWLSDATWKELCGLDKLSAFEGESEISQICFQLFFSIKSVRLTF